MINETNKNKPYFYHKEILEILIKCAENEENT